MESRVLPHNQESAAVWGAPGRAYDEMSRSMAPAIEHCVLRLAPRPAERALDIATGTGWTARCVAAYGARVSGIDFAVESIQAAREIAAELRLDIDFHVADAEALPYPDGHFDIVISTFGVMFAGNQQGAARELARVCRKGGRIALASWLLAPIDASEGREALNGETAKVLAPYLPAPASSVPPSPFNWGDADWLQRELGELFELGYEFGTLYQRFADGEDAWQLYLDTFGPLQAVVATLDDDRRTALKADYSALFERFRTGLGLSVPIDYLVAVGVRR